MLAAVSSASVNCLDLVVMMYTCHSVNEEKHTEIRMNFRICHPQVCRVQEHPGRTTHTRRRTDVLQANPVGRGIVFNQNWSKQKMFFIYILILIPPSNLFIRCNPGLSGLMK
jgi:hypothetical protein